MIPGSKRASDSIVGFTKRQTPSDRGETRVQRQMAKDNAGKAGFHSTIEDKKYGRTFEQTPSSIRTNKDESSIDRTPLSSAQTESLVSKADERLSTPISDKSLDNQVQRQQATEMANNAAYESRSKVSADTINSGGAKNVTNGSAGKFQKDLKAVPTPGQTAKKYVNLSSATVLKALAELSGDDKSTENGTIDVPKSAKKKKISNEKSNVEQPGNENGEGDTHTPSRTATISPISGELKEDLPVVAHREEFRVKCKSSEHAVVLVVGETGSGKTTKLPQFLLDDQKARRIAVTQPRRVAATTLARRVAFERRQKLGTEVGYRVRFEDVTSKDTRLVFCTDGLLLREAMHDPALRSYDWIVLDEAHERSLNTDVLFGVVKRALALRNTDKKIQLRVVVMSATIDVQLFEQFFNASVMNVEGRQYPVEVWYLPEPLDDRIDACARAALQVHEDEPLPGDILVFLAGKDEIDTCCRSLEKAKQNIIVCPLHASLPSHVQMKAFERAPMGFRKVVVATNVAETSVTVDGVRFVIDSGVAKVKRRDRSTGIKKLLVTPVSKSQSWQRCGRAGREAPGECYRMYTESVFESMRQDAEPEILRVDLSEVVMQLLALGVKNITTFDFLQSPDKTALMEALTELHSLGAIAKLEDKTVGLSEKGRKMSALPVEPIYANLLLKAIELGCVEEIAGIIAMGGGLESPFFGQGEEASVAYKKWINASGDHLTNLGVLEGFAEAVEKGTAKQFARDNFVRFEVLTQALQARKQLVDICKGFQSGVVAKDESTTGIIETRSVQRCLAIGLGTRIAKRVGKNEYEPLLGTKDGSRAFIHPSCVLSTLNLRPEYVVFDEMLVTSKTYLRGVSAVENTSWLANDQPGMFKEVNAKETGDATSEAEKQLIQERKAKKIGRSLAID